jgi:stage V sporulation protein B
MSTAFPIRESSIFGLAELVARLLGLAFLARFMDMFGLVAGGEFRTVLPTLFIAAAVGSVGLPQALTRLFAASSAKGLHGIPKDHLSITVISTLGAELVTLLSVMVIFTLTSQDESLSAMSHLLSMSIPLLILMTLSGSLSGVLIGLGANFAPAIAQIIDAVVTFTLVNPHMAQVLIHFGLNDAGAAIAIITLAEATATVFLLLVFVIRCKKQKLSDIVPTQRLSRSMKEYWTVLRMSLSPTVQSLFESAGYALELPLAGYLLTRSMPAQASEHIIAQYAAVAIPLLHFPMFVTDGMATALLPRLTLDRTRHGSMVMSQALQQILKSVAMVAIPATGTLYVLAPLLTHWFDSPGPGATWILRSLCLFTFPLYLTAPLSALVQAQGRSRSLMIAGLYSDVSRIAVLWLAFTQWHMQRSALILSFSTAVCVQTAVLLYHTGLFRFRDVPWRSIAYTALGTVTMLAVFITGMHVHGIWSMLAEPVPWLLLGFIPLFVFLFVSGELSPAMVSKIPWIGPKL